MGAITRSIANNITTSGVFTSSAITNASVTGITVLANAPADGITLISSQTASASASISFTTGLDSTYKAYKFVFVNIHPANDNIDFRFNLSSDGGSNYNVTKTTTVFNALHTEADATSFGYNANADLAQITGYQPFGFDAGNANDENTSGSLILFNPSSTIYVKHFIANMNCSENDESTRNLYIAGYANTTSAINAIRFIFNSGNIDAGTIYLYGIK
jgi:hypothetical protein